MCRSNIGLMELSNWTVLSSPSLLMNSRRLSFSDLFVSCFLDSTHFMLWLMMMNLEIWSKKVGADE